MVLPSSTDTCARQGARVAGRRVGQRVVGIAAVLVLSLLASGIPVAPASATPRSEQWHLDAINVSKAHEVSRGDGVTIGLMTHGLPPSHPDLVDRVLPAMRLSPGLWTSIEQAPADYPAIDDRALAEIGLMVARGGSGMLGVAPAAKVRPVICPGFADEIDRCMRWLVDNGVDVIKFSSFAENFDQSFDGIRYALANDVVVVAAFDEVARMPPSLWPGLVVVGGGLGRDNELEPTVQGDGRVTVRAPGIRVGIGVEGQIYGLDRKAEDGGGYGPLLTLSDDRIAAALVTGVVALIRSANPDLNAPSVINRLIMTARDHGDPGRDATYGYGVVDAGAALHADVPTVTANPLGDPGSPSSGLTRWIQFVADSGVIGSFVTAAAIVAIVVLWQRRRRPLPR